ncbi:MAG: hypothetical protein U0176_20420 [Bacteroidia bacterium]
MRAFLLTYGDPDAISKSHICPQRVGSWGFTCFENPHPEYLAATVANADVLEPSIIVLCAADADYFSTGAEWMSSFVPHCRRHPSSSLASLKAGRP